MGTYSTSEKTREALITAAGELVAKNGFAKVSTRAIAEKAEENISSIHYHFGGKDKLLEEVVRTATQRHRERPTSEIIEDFRSVLHTPEGQSRAVKALVKRFIAVIFGQENPWWYSYVPYQIMKSENSLQKLIKAGVIDNDFASLMDFIKIVKPELSSEQLKLYVKLFLAPIIIHTQNIEKGLLYNEHQYSADYLSNLERNAIKLNHCLLDLPN